MYLCSTQELPCASCLQSHVGDFAIDATPVTNAQYDAFVRAGGYQQQQWWLPEDYSWVQRNGVTGPVFWVTEEGGTHGNHSISLRRMFTHVPMFASAASSAPSGRTLDTAQAKAAAATPVTVSQAEAAAYCAWKGGRLPSEPQWLRASLGAGGGAAGGGDTGIHGNWGFWSWGTSPVGRFSAGDSVWGVADMLGNGWEWTRTPFHGHPGFTANLPTYQGYSADFFDGKHFTLLGGSWATDTALLRAPFRNFFQAHYPYVFASFRCTYPSAAATTTAPQAALALSAKAMMGTTAAGQQGSGAAAAQAAASGTALGNGVHLKHLGPVTNLALRDAMARDVLVGLTATPKHIPCMFLYDDTGSDLFEAITALPEYYPTRTEALILEAHKEAIAAVAAAPTPRHADAALAALDAGAAFVSSGKRTSLGNYVGVDPPHTPDVRHACLHQMCPACPLTRWSWEPATATSH